MHRHLTSTHLPPETASALQKLETRLTAYGHPLSQVAKKMFANVEGAQNQPQLTEAFTATIALASTRYTGLQHQALRAAQILAGDNFSGLFEFAVMRWEAMATAYGHSGKKASPNVVLHRKDAEALPAHTNTQNAHHYALMPIAS